MNQKPCRNYQKLCHQTLQRHFKKTETSKTFQKTEPYFRRCTQMHQNFATRAACQIVGDWLPASSIDQRPSRPTKEKMTSQQIKTNSYHILSCSDNNYQIQILTIHSPEVMQNQIYSEAMQKLARDSQLLFQSSQSRVAKLQGQISQRPWITTRCCSRSDPAISQHESETNENQMQDLSKINQPI